MPFRRLFSFDLNVQILQLPHSQTDKDQGHGETSQDSPSPQWVELGARRVTNLWGFVASLQLTDDQKLTFNPFADSTELILHNNTSGYSLLSFLFKMILKSKNSFADGTTEVHRGLQGFRFRYTGERQTVTDTSGEEVSADRWSERDLVSRTLNVDGERRDSNVTSVDCRLHPRFVPVFGIEVIPT